MKSLEETTNINIEDIVIDKEKNIKTKPKSEKKPETTSEIKPEKDMKGLENIVKNDFQEKTIIEMPTINTKKIGIAADHRGYKMKQKLTNYLNKKGYTVIDYGGNGLKDDAYTEFGFKLGEAVQKHEVEKGIAICGSGIGISIACNKVKTVRCAKVNNTKEVKWACHDNDANIIALSAKMPMFRAKDIIDTFLKTEFSKIQRHQYRIDALNTYKG